MSINENSEEHPKSSEQIRKVDSFWKKSTALTFFLLLFWALFSLGFGIIFRTSLDNLSIGGAPLGFWFAQQGSIYAFILIILIYNIAISSIEKRYGITDKEDIKTHHLE